MKPNVRPGVPCEFPVCATDRCAVHEWQGRRLCSYHSPFDVDWTEEDA